MDGRMTDIDFALSESRKVTTYFLFAKRNLAELQAKQHPL